jgi:hypothetical protein
MRTLFLVIGLIYFNLFMAQTTVNLTITFCNSTLSGLGSNFYWTTNGAEQYRVQITLGASTWIYAPGFTSSGFPKTFTNLVFAGVNPQYSTTYTVQVDYMVSGVWQNNWGPSCTVTTPPASNIQLESTFCNASLATLSTTFRAQTLSGGTTWRFKVTNTVDGTSSILDKGSSYGSTTTRRTTSIQQVATDGTGNLSAIGQAIYTVECAVSVQGGPFTSYGTLCNITITQPIQLTIVPEDCGVEHNYLFQDVLNTTPPTISTGCTYQFRLVDQSNMNAIESPFVSVPYIKIYDIPGYAYGKTYKASVKCIRQGIMGSYGTECILYTEDVPYTKIQDGQFGTTDNCDITVPTFAQRVYAFAIPGCIDYQFEINTNGPQGILYKNTGNIRHFRLSEVPGYINEYNKIYTVRVRVNMGNGFGPYNESCTVKTPLAIIIQPNNQISPNPFTNTFKIDSIQPTTPVLITDLSGKVMEKVIDPTGEIGGNLPTGMYYVIIEDKVYKIFKN